MKRKISLLILLISGLIMFSGCASSNHSSYTYKAELKFKGKINSPWNYNPGGLRPGPKHFNFQYND